MLLDELQAEVNSILKNTFKEEELKENNPLWLTLIDLVPKSANASDIALIIACNYILLTYQGSSNIEDNKESFKLGNASYDGTNDNVARINQANNILSALGFSKISFGVVNA